jgi:four helix bundle protein
MGDYRSLRVWQKAHQLTLAVYEITEHFPKSEVFGLTSQLRRSAVSIPSNPAEGSGRNTQRELAHFCRIALGCANELEYQLLLARDLGYLAADPHEALAADVDRLKRMLASFVRTLP